MVKKVALTGDRPTGPLHLGHYIGSLRSRVEMQDNFDQFIMLADLQGLTDNFNNPEKISSNIMQVCLDYLSVGIDPEKSTIFIQSQIPAIYILTKIYLNLVTVARLYRNPTVKEEIKLRDFENSLPAGFLVYPVSQAADITSVMAQVVPAGADQIPMIEQCNEIVDKFNNLYGETLVRCQAIVPTIGRLPGTDGQGKMGKSLNNAIYLSDTPDVLKKKIMAMYTDPNHVRVEDPGSIEGNPVFTYLDAFDDDKSYVQGLKDHYQKGGLGDVVVKKYLLDVLEHKLAPIRERRLQYSKDLSFVWDVLKKGCEKTRNRSEIVLNKVKSVMKIDYFK